MGPITSPLRRRGCLLVLIFCVLIPFTIMMMFVGPGRSHTLYVFICHFRCSYLQNVWCEVFPINLRLTHFSRRPKAIQCLRNGLSWRACQQSRQPVRYPCEPINGTQPNETVLGPFAGADVNGFDTPFSARACWLCLRKSHLMQFIDERRWSESTLQRTLRRCCWLIFV